MNLWASTDLCFLYLPDTQPFPFYYRTDKLRLYYRINPDFWAWLQQSVAAALRSSPIPPEEMEKVYFVESYVSKTFPRITGSPHLPEAESADTYDRRLQFVDGCGTFVRDRDFIAWRPMG